MTRLAHEVGALFFVDAVHSAPHSLIDVVDLDCDFLACSAYKFFGPHVGLLWGRRDLLEKLEVYKLRPAPNSLPGKWMTGTQNHECIAGTRAAIDYLAGLGRLISEQPAASRREALRTAFDAIRTYESDLIWKLIEGIQNIPQYTLYGIGDRSRADERLPTISIRHATRSPQELARLLGERGCFVWHGNYYAQPLTERLGVEPDGMIRLGLVHYNTSEEVDRVLAALNDLAS